MSEMMLERVARAMCPEFPDETDARWGDDGRHYPKGEPHWRVWVDDARRVVEAMRTMTDEMRVAAITTGLPMKIGDPPLYEAIWRNVIDAILANIPVEPLPPMGGRP